MKDRFASLEQIDTPKVIGWAKKRDREARRSVKKYSDVLFRRLVPFYRLPIMRSVQLTRQGGVQFFSDESSYRVEMLRKDGSIRQIEESRRLCRDAVIQSVQARRDGHTLALH